MNAEPKIAVRRQRMRAGGCEDILSAGREVFLRDGQEASMDEIAALAGVARRTLFNQFGSKDALFEAILLKSSEESLPQLVIGASKDIRADLLDFANRYVTAITGETVVQIYRMLRGGGAKAAARLYKDQQTHYMGLRNMLAVYFADRIAAGEMIPFNVKFGAERFLASVVGMARVEVSLGIEPPTEDRANYVEDTVDRFLDGILPRQKPGDP